ncbi:hypothetical protein J6R97_03710 [bacterium]|nr:hypothetical protein [bacterium]
MRIQQQNSYNPNMKALYFTKTIPMRSEAIDYINPKITKSGIKYVEDNSAKLTPIMKEAFAENRFIKNLAEKFDVFVQYLGESFSFDSFGSSTSIHVVRQEDNQVLSDSYIFTANDKYTPEGARYRLLDKIRSEQHIDKSTYKLGK